MTRRGEFIVFGGYKTLLPFAGYPLLTGGIGFVN